MLVVPVTEKFSWKNPPFVTIVLVLVNIVIFAGFQGGDNEKWEKAASYYFSSGLANLEVPLFQKLRDSQNKPLTVPEQFRQSKAFENFYVLSQMEQDNGFQKMIRDEQVVLSSSQDFGIWKELRNTYQGMKNGIFSNRYQFVPSEHRPVTFISHMFLHGSFGHLFGNMIFLWLFGCIVEMGCGRLRFLMLYLVTGLGAVSFFWLTQLSSLIGLVGASGAISGLMGAYTVLFGKSRIKLFMYLGFYFNYIRIPAIILLPFWLFREMYALFSNTGSHVAYAAHIGGIVSGAVYGYVFLKFTDFKKHDVLIEEKKDRSMPLVEEALSMIGKLEFEKGRAFLEQAIKENKENYAAYRHIYNMEKQNPESESFHTFVRKYLKALCADESEHGAVFNLYSEYRKLSKPRLSPDVYLTLSFIFSKQGKIQEAEEIIVMIIRNKPELAHLPAAVLRLSEAFRKKGLPDMATKYLDILCSRYPETPEAAMAIKELKKSVTS